MQRLGGRTQASAVALNVRGSQVNPSELQTDSDSKTEWRPEKHQDAGLSEPWDQVELVLKESSLGLSQRRVLCYFTICTFLKALCVLNTSTQMTVNSGGVF